MAPELCSKAMRKSSKSLSMARFRAGLICCEARVDDFLHQFRSVITAPAWVKSVKKLGW